MKEISSSLSTFISFFVLAVAQIILAPSILALTDASTLGVYAILLQLLGCLALLDFGFTASFQRQLSRTYGIKPRDEVEEFLNTSRIYFALIDLLRAGFGYVILKTCSSFAHNPIAFQSLLDVYWMLAFWYVFRGALAIYSPALVALREMALNNYFVIISNLTRMSSSIVLLLLGFDLPALVIGIVISELVLAVLSITYFSRLFLNLSQPLKGVNKSNINEVIAYGLKTFPIGLTTVARQQSDGFIAGLTLGPIQAAILYVTKLPVFMAQNIIYSLILVAAPTSHRLHSEGKSENLNEIFFVLHKYIFTSSFIIFYGLALFHRDFVTYWVGEAQYAGNSFTYLFMLAVVISCSSAVNAQFNFVDGDVKTFSRLNIFESIAIIVTSYSFSLLFGLEGILIASILCSLPSAFYLWRRSLIRYCNSVSAFLISTVVIPFSVITLASIPFVFTPRDGGLFLFSMLFYSLVSFICFVSVILTDEHQLLLKRYIGFSK